MNKWVNPPHTKKEEETYDADDDFTINPPPSFTAYLKQIKKKPPSKKSKRNRVADKGVLLSKRLRNKKDK